MYLAIGARYRALHDENKQAGERVRRAEQNARIDRQIREQQGHFIDLVTHEYRTPLAVLQTNLDILEIKDGERRQHGNLQAMAGAIKRLAEIFNNSLSQGNWGDHRRVILERTDLERFLRDLMANVEASWKGNPRSIDFHVESTATIAADPHALKTIFLNLLDNAAKYAPSGSPVKIVLASANGRAQVSVGNACAVAPELDAATLLEKYTRGANSQGAPGRGMGLYLVKKLIEEIGGRIVLRLDTPGWFEAVLTFEAPTHAEVA